MSNIPRFFQSEGMALHNTITYSLLKIQEYFYCHVVQTFLPSETDNETEYKRYNTVIGNKTIQFFPYNTVKIPFNSDTILTCICSLRQRIKSVLRNNKLAWQTIKLAWQAIKLAWQTIKLAPQFKKLAWQTIKLAPQTIKLAPQTIKLAPQTIKPAW